MPVASKASADLTGRLADRLSRTAPGRRAARLRDELRHRVVPTHWTSLFGVIAAACLAVLTVTGLVLMCFYTPSNAELVYDGSYRPLHGARVSEAFASTMRISFELPGGLLLRQAHHWAALLLPAAIVGQLVVAFFTGAFRRPRRAAWALLVLLLVAALAGGWSGYALPDDLLSGTGLRIVEGIVLGIPVIGTPLKELLFGGAYPGEIVANLYPLHLAVVPAMAVLLAVRLWRAYRSGPPQFAGPGRTEGNVVGLPLFPQAVVRASGLLLIAGGVLLLVATFVTVNPIWLYGPASPGEAGAGSQPDWYTGFLDGALRLVPPGWEVVAFDRTWTLAVLAPLAVVGVFFLVLAAYPLLEERATGDRREHHLLDRPRNTPIRTGVGAAGLVFVGVLWAAGSADLAAVAFSLSLEGVVLALQLGLLVGPAIAFELARRVSLGLRHRDREVLAHGYETGRIVRRPGGEYVEIHRQPDPYERWRLLDGRRPRDAAGKLQSTGCTPVVEVQ